jgi:hypothetical protein
VRVDLAAHGPFQRCKDLTQLRLDLRDLELDLENLPQGRKKRGVIDIGLGIVAPGKIEGLPGAGQDALAEQGEDVWPVPSSPGFR